MLVAPVFPQLKLTPGKMKKKDVFFMTKVLEEARAAALRGDVPVGAAVVRGDTILSLASNRKETDPTAHAEVLAIRRAAEEAGVWNLRGCTMYVTAEPCPMCAGAIVLARIDRLVYGCSDPKSGACGTLYDITGDRRLNHRPSVTAGVLEEECGALLTGYFIERRKSRPPGRLQKECVE